MKKSGRQALAVIIGLIMILSLFLPVGTIKANAALTGDETPPTVDGVMFYVNDQLLTRYSTTTNVS